MKLFFAFYLFLSSLAFAAGYKDYRATLTFYYPGNGGQVGTKTSTGKKAVSGVTMAVDPKIIPYHSKIYVRELGRSYYAQDTGSAVVKRTASKKRGNNYIVVDIFCDNKKKFLDMKKKWGKLKYVTIRVYKKK